LVDWSVLVESFFPNNAYVLEFRVFEAQSSAKWSRVWQVARAEVFANCVLRRLRTVKLGSSPEKALQ
jgi:hypothetical protein